MSPKAPELWMACWLGCVYTYLKRLHEFLHIAERLRMAQTLQCASEAGQRS